MHNKLYLGSTGPNAETVKGQIRSGEKGLWPLTVDICYNDDSYWFSVCRHGSEVDNMVRSEIVLRVRASGTIVNKLQFPSQTVLLIPHNAEKQSQQRCYCVQVFFCFFCYKSIQKTPNEVQCIRYEAVIITFITFYNYCKGKPNWIFFLSYKMFLVCQY